MNIKAIYDSFYEAHIRNENTTADTRREEIMQFLASKGFDRSDLCTIDTMLGGLCVAQEKEAFMDGFAAGVDHIAGAFAFSASRLAE